MTITGKKLISIVSPAYNEAENVPLMIEEVKKVMETLSEKYDFEYIIVNDGSIDNTWDVIVDETKKDRRIKGICLSRNFSHQIALTAGLDNAMGDAVIYCDSDLQHPPEIFPKLIQAWERGSFVVHTIRISTEGEPFVKKLMSDLFYRFVNLFSNVKIEKGMADFKLLDKSVLDKLKVMREHNRFLRGLVPWVGYSSSRVEYTAGKRLHGKPWYNFRRNLSFAKSGVLAFSVQPLKIIGYLGICLTSVSILILIYGAVAYLITGLWYLSPIFLISIFNTFLMGLVLSSLGIMALYITYIYYEVLNRPLYIVSEKTFENE